MSNIDYTTLVSYLAEIPDPRSPRGQRYEWHYLLILIAAAMLTGASTPTTISNWVAMHQVALVAALRPVRKSVPSMATLRRALCAVPIETLEAALGRYQAQLAGETGDAGMLVTKQGEMLRGAALDVNHYPRDVSFGEDRCQVRSGNAPQALAALRNAIAALLHVAGWPFLPNGFRYCQRSPQIPLQLIGGLAT
jgi:hypothetical protein